MPEVRENESKPDYMKRCIPFVLDDGSASDEDQATAMCSTMWDDAQKSDRMRMQYKIKPFGLVKGAIKDVDSQKRIVTGFFNTSNFFDSDNDIMLPGAAKKSIAERGVNSSSTAKIKHALNHDLTKLPGKLITLDERTIDGVSGIYFESKMADTTLGDDTLKNYLTGIYDNHSIGFQYLNYEFVENGSEQWKELIDTVLNPADMAKEETAVLIKEIKLYEGSTVAFGANSLTPFLGLKGVNVEAVKADLFRRLNLLTHTVKNGDQSDDMIYTLSLQVKQLQQIIQEIEFQKVAPTAKQPEAAAKSNDWDWNKICNYFNH